MARNISQGQPQGAGATEKRDIVWVVLIWGRVTAGLMLAAVSGLAFGHAWTRQYTSLWWLNAMTMLAGALLVLSGLYARSRPPGVIPHIMMEEELSEGQQPLVPLLGALLAYKYKRITQKQLNEALERQQKERQNRRRLGEILVQMGAITRPELEEALKDQRSVLSQKRSTEAS
jgi:hypothetical protein